MKLNRALTGHELLPDEHCAGVYSLAADEAYSLAGKGLRAVFLQLWERRIAAQDVMAASTAKSVQFAKAM